MNLQSLRCVLFDLDGTLLDSLPGIVHSVNHACRAMGVPEPDADLRPLLGPPIRSIFAKVTSTQDAALLDRLEAAFRSHYDTEGWRMTSCFAGASQMLQAMQARGCRLFVMSNKPLHISLQILELESLLSLFEKIYTRDSRKPPYASKAEMLGEFLLDHGVPPSECLLVGDTMEDITASAANGVPAAFMQHGYGNLPSEVAVQYRLQNFAEFLDVVAIGEAR